MFNLFEYRNDEILYLQMQPNIILRKIISNECFYLKLACLKIDLVMILYKHKNFLYGPKGFENNFEFTIDFV